MGVALAGRGRWVGKAVPTATVRLIRTRSSHPVSANLAHTNPVKKKIAPQYWIFIQAFSCDFLCFFNVDFFLGGRAEGKSQK